MSNHLKSVAKAKTMMLLCLLLGLLVLGSTKSARRLEQSLRKVSSTPNRYDWRQHTTMTPVKDQTTCLAYYAFSTVAFFEQDLILYEGAPASIDLSEQFLTTCLPSGGCNGGDPKDAMDYAMSKGGIPQQSQYPFSPYGREPEGICYPDELIQLGDRPIVSFFNVNDQQFIKQLILKQPLNIYICSQDLKSYGPTSNSDRLLSCDPDNINTDHSVLLIGYTETEWIIKNSWGSDWGLGGYGYISRNSQNDCCIGTQIFLRETQSQQCEVQNCQVCTDKNFCAKCQPGFYIKNQQSSHICTECMEKNCAVCEDNVGYCKTCVYGYALIFPETSCSISPLQHCKLVVNGGCKQCHTGYKVDPQEFKCVSACQIQNCRLCKNDKSCSQCLDGFDLVYQNDQLICKQNNCKTQNCASCQQGGRCLTCVGSYSLVEDSCQMLCEKPNCLECSETIDQCVKCQEGYALDYYSSQCVFTQVSNCLETYLTKYCSICQEGYQRSDSWEQCNKICKIQNCKTCQLGVSNKCIACEQGYSLKVPENQTIAICEKNKCQFQNCSLCNAGSTSCFECIDQYHVWSAAEQACVPYTCHLANCQKCDPQATVCEQCKAGTILELSTGSCMESPIENCEEILNVGGGQAPTYECRNCMMGYQVNYDTWNSCKRICSDKNCKECTESASVCDQCFDGFAIKNDTSGSSQCVKIPVYLPNCQRANYEQTFCFQCKQFYQWSESELSCVLNENCPTDCIKCTNPNEALKCQCKKGYVWDFLNKECVVNPSDQNCLVISNYTGTQECFECKEGFSLTQDGKGCQYTCAVQNCRDCVESNTQNYPEYCQQCMEGFIVTPNLTRCVPCTVQYCSECASFEDRGTCNNCKLGYILQKDGSCKQIECPANSQFNGIECGCLPSFYSDSKSGKCLTCGQQCRKCTSKDRCLQCKDGSFLQNGTCKKCFQNCQDCNDKTTCNTCQQGYSYQQVNGTNICREIGIGNEGYVDTARGKVRCPAGCASCKTNQQVCEQCLDGYILENDGRCVKCSANCKTCYSNILGACKSCEIGFTLIDGQCRRCSSQFCLSCPTTQEICTQCIQGYYVKDQKCTRCGLGCKRCDTEGFCLECHSGFALFEQEGYCSQCLDGCSMCRNDTMDTCEAGCMQGNYQTDEGQCMPCAANCKSCTGKNTCQECIPGYDLVQDKCVKWCEDPNCYDCSDDSSICATCFQGYTLQNGNCVEDLSCNDQPNCTVCPKMYYLNESLSTCYDCQTTDQNCNDCSINDPTECTGCVLGYYLNPEQNQCQMCSKECQRCRSSDYCYICNEGYFMLEQQQEYSGKCGMCSQNCLTCIDSPTNCLSCKEGYTLSVAKFCMNNDAIQFVIRLDMEYRKYSQEARNIRHSLNGFFGDKDTHYTQFVNVTEGSTIMEGYTSIPQGQEQQGQTYQSIVRSLQNGQRVAGYHVLSASVSYNGQTYNSQDGNGDDGGVEGWVIAVAVIGGIAGLIILIILISFIAKKLKQRKYQSEATDQIVSSGKNTESHLKKENPELRM